MSETPSKYGNKEDRPPLNFEPADGEYTFRVGKLKETDVRVSAKGTGYVKVALISDCGAYVKTSFFATPKAVGKALDLAEAATGKRPAAQTITDQFTLADLINSLQGKFVKATIKKGEPREWNGKTYTDYEVGSFKQPF